MASTSTIYAIARWSLHGPLHCLSFLSDELDEVRDLVTCEMSSVMHLAVRLKVDIQLGANWEKCE